MQENNETLSDLSKVMQSHLTLSNLKEEFYDRIIFDYRHNKVPNTFSTKIIEKGIELSQWVVRNCFNVNFLKFYLIDFTKIWISENWKADRRATTWSSC